ncbi:hypothetical protein [Nocardioides sp.]|uniref:hypothetical protein n=1 Tax=Nocardioides sp. TaxID=35761 RepID=UPI0035653F73
MSRPVRARRHLAAVAAASLVASLGACSTRQETYCNAVTEHQEELSRIIDAGGPDALIRALDIFGDLQSKAPSDIRDEWQQVVGRIRALEDALEAAEVDPATYDRDDPPDGVTDAERARIDAAARELGSIETQTALESLDQQARDVCQTPLTL